MLAKYADAQSQRELSDPRGCFVLNHDTPSTLRPYNTTGDLLRYIQVPLGSVRVWLRSHTQEHETQINAGQPVVLGLCWKNVPGGNPCANTSASNAWLSLVDDFVASANSLVSARGLNVAFGMDGGGTVRYPCLQQRWRPWVSTYVQGRDPAGVGLCLAPIAVVLALTECRPFLATTRL